MKNECVCMRVRERGKESVCVRGVFVCMHVCAPVCTRLCKTLSSV